MPYIIKHKEGFYSNLSKEEVEQKCKDLGQKAIEVRYNEQSFDTFSKSFFKPDENIVWDGDTIMEKYWAASKHIAYEEKVDIPRKRKKEIIVETIVAVCMFACLFWAIAYDRGITSEHIKPVRTERTNSRTNDAPHYSSWSDCVSIQIVPRAAYGIGQDVIVKNICSHTISKVVVTVTADGRSKDTYYFNIAPGESDMSAITVAADAFLYVSDVQVFF